MGNMLFDFILHPAFVVVSAGSAQPIWVGKKHPI